MRVILLPAAVLFTMIPCLWAGAQERMLSGEVSVAPLHTDIQGSGAKFNEYRDLRSGFHGRLGIHYERENDHFDLQGHDMGYRDQGYELEGGRGGIFQYHLGYDATPHNFPSGGKVQR